MIQKLYFTLFLGFTEILDRLDYPMWKSSLAGFSRDRIVYQQEYKSYPVSTDGATESGCYRLQKACCQYALALHRVGTIVITLQDHSMIPVNNSLFYETDFVFKC